MVPGPAMELLGRIAYEATQMKPLLPTYLHLLVSAIFPIYIAAHASLERPSSSAKPEQKKKAKAADCSIDDDDDDLEVVQKIEGLTAWDAITFPLLAGATLTSLYLIIKWLEDPTILNKILAVYFSQLGMFFGVRFLKDIFSTIRSILLPTQYSNGELVWHAQSANSCFTAKSNVEKKSHSSPLPGVLRRIPLPKSLSSSLWSFRKIIYTKAKLQLNIYKVLKVRCGIDLLDVFSIAVVVSILAWQAFISTPWYLTNFMGFAFCYGSLQMVSPTTGWIGTLVLSALFFYDIYFVFFTPMMVTVATKLEVPIKLLFPKPDGCVMPVGAFESSEAMEDYLQCLSKKRTMAMLGLGDIVIPGMMLAFALRFDLYLFYLRMKTNNTQASGADSSKKPKYISATGNWGERLWTQPSLQSIELQVKTFPKPYFHASVFGYIAGMIVTMIVMQVFQHAQPALLYLVPGVLLSFWGTALARGDLKLLWDYTEESEDDDKETGKKETAVIEDIDELKTKWVEKCGNGFPGRIGWYLNVLMYQILGVSLISTAKTDKRMMLSGRKAGTSDPVDAGKTGKGDSTTDSSTLSEEVSDKMSTEPSKPDSQISLISFSITLTTKHTASSANTTVQSSHESTPTSSAKPSKSSSNDSPSSSYSFEDVLPDVKADHEVMAKLSREITREKEVAPITTTKDGQPAEKRRRKF